MHISSYDIMKGFVQNHLGQFKNEKMAVLDIGSCDVNGTYKPLFDNKNWKYFGADIDAGKNVDILLKNSYNWKNIRSNSFDVVISGQAFEHINYFWVTMFEMVRVLKQGGLCCIIAPSGGPEHKYPVDCWRFFPDGFTALAGYVGVKVIEAGINSESPPDGSGSEMWKDSHLIAQKPYMSVQQQIAFSTKCKLSKFLLKL